MELKKIAGYLGFFLLIFMAVGFQINQFFDIQTIVLMLGIPFCLAVSDSNDLNFIKKINKYIIPAGFILFIIGIILMAGNLTDLNSFGPSLAVNTLPLFYMMLLKLIMKSLKIKND